MGDARFDVFYQKVLRASDRRQALLTLSDAEVIQALAAASRAPDPLLANVIATEALNRTRRVRAALANLADGVAALARDGGAVWLNPAAERLLGVRLADVIGQNFHDLVRHADANGDRIPRGACPILRAAREGTTAQGDGHFFEASSGDRLCVAFTVGPILDEAGEVEGAVLVFRDCAERKRAERSLRESHERYKSLFASLPEPIITIGFDGRILDANRAAEEMTARPVSESRDHDFAEYLHPDDAERAAQLFASILAGVREESTLRIRHADGRYLRVRALGIPIVVDGEVVGVHGLVRPAD